MAPRKKKRLTKHEKKTAELEQSLARALADGTAYSERAINEAAARRRAEETEKKTREQFADLKRRLHESEVECAKLRGVINRVDREDELRERAALIAAGKALSQDPPPVMTRDFGDRFRGQYAGEQPQHWTNY